MKHRSGAVYRLGSDRKMSLTQETILTFILERGGKVKNSELVNNFKVLINSGDPAEKKEKRDLFKRLVNNVAVVKQVDDVTHVVVKKKHRGETMLDNSLIDLKSPCGNWDILNNNCNSFSSGTVGKNSKCPSFKSNHHPEGTSECLTARVLTVTSHVRSQTGSVFALVAIKSPPKCDERKTTKTEEAQGIARSVKLQATECQKGVCLYRSTRTKRKELEAQGSPQLRRCSKIRPGNEETDEEHEWLVESAKGCWSRIYGLLLQHPRLAEKRNFMSGFTILHWAAKSGICETVCKVIDIARQSAGGIDVNGKSYDGYTPLHIAAIHSHERVLSLLVCQYGANTNIRDNGGKKPFHYLSRDVSFEMRKMLGDPRILLRNAHCHSGDGQNIQDFPKGLNTLSKLFQPHIVGRKKKCRRPQSFHFISDH